MPNTEYNYFNRQFFPLDYFNFRPQRLRPHIYIGLHLHNSKSIYIIGMLKKHIL